MFDAGARELCVAVLGSGAMGRGIAQILAQAGVTVLLFDAVPQAAEQAVQSLHANFDSLQAKGKISSEAALDAKACLQIVQHLADLAPATLAIEAIIEDLAVKQALFAELEGILPDDAVLASNTSSLSITELASACRVPQRVAGFHFFNPVPLMKVVEVVRALHTAPAVVQSLCRLAQRCGHLPVQTQDTPGFIVNHAGRGYGGECLKILAEGVASVQEIDSIMREAAGFRLGPFELFDLTGLDVSVPVMEAIYHQYFEEARYRPSPLAVQRKNAGLLGRKTGQGFYRYQDGKPLLAPAAKAPVWRVGKVWISRDHAQWGAQLAELVQKLGAQIDDQARPAADALCLTTPLGEDVSTCLLRQGLDARRTLGLDMLLGCERRRILLSNPLTEAQHLAFAHGLLVADGAPVSIVRDSVGLLVQRVLAHIINIACDMAQQGIATPDDIDCAVKLGLAYPHGPLAWGDQLGAENILLILQRMQAITGDMRYRPSPWLRRRAQLQASLLQTETAYGER